MLQNPLKRKRPSKSSQRVETPEQKALKCLSKYHHAGVEAVRALKKALTFELQKSIKRLNKAREASPIEPIMEARLTAEVESAKSIQCDPLATYYLEHTIQKSHKELASLLEIEEIRPAPHRDADDHYKNVVARLFGSKTFKDSITGSIQSLEVIAGVAKPVLKKSKTSKQKATATVQRQDGTNSAVRDATVPLEESPESDASDGSAEIKTTKRVRSEPDPDMKGSTFLPSLQSGYLAADNSSDDEGELKGLFPAQKKERKNRRGQRARRKILEAKHGKKANHLVRERQEAQAEYEERVARRAAKEAAKTGANAIAIEEAEKNRRERREAKLRPIHGSWAIAKAQKEKMKAAKPEGTKISFD